MRVLIFGDSIAQGFFDSRGGWANRVANAFHQDALKNLNNDYPEVINLGVSGDTVENILNRIEDETDVRRSATKTYLVIAVGMNDSLLVNNHAYEDEYKFQEQYEKLENQLIR